MKTLFLLITLTQNGAGDINASFVNTETLEQCQQKSLMLESVFIASNIPLIENRCIESEMKFSEFNHASAASKIRNFYFIYQHGKMMDISTMQDWRSCVDRKNLESRQGRAYCASSVQFSSS